LNLVSSRPFQLHLGTAYYPEHWPEERWFEDIHLMRKVGLTVARLGEFAWSTMEPEPGKFCFDWLDRAIEMLASNEIPSILGTPTAAPPAWLVQLHPQILAVDENNRKVQFGNRCHYCVNSPEFHDAVYRLVQSMAEHFGSNPNVIGWQIDNEFNRVCYCDRCQAAFQKYLFKKYGALEEINERWSTRYWSQTYSAWDQIPIPIGNHNPSLMLEFKHFVTHSYQAFQTLQVDLLRKYILPTTWITHNFMGWYDGYDPYQLCKNLDIASWDWYIGSGHNDYLKSGAMHDLTRSFKQKNFILMETQPGHINWSGVNNVLNKSEARAMAWHAVAHGADGVLYWQWRSAPGGQEQYHGTLVDQSGQPRPFFEEARLIGQEFAKVSDLLAGSVPKAKIGIIYDPDSRWSINWQRHHQDFDYLTFFNQYYSVLAAMNLGIDILAAGFIDSSSRLSNYRILVIPAMILLRDELIPILKDYVKRGGHIVLTLRTGMKDIFNAILPTRQPGGLAELAGVQVEEYYALDQSVPIRGNWLDGYAQIWAERLKLIESSSIQVIARYGESNGWLDGQPAITVNAFGKGLVYFNGAYLDPASQLIFTQRLLKNANLKPVTAPPGVEIAARVRSDRKEITFAINHTQETKEVSYDHPAIDFLTGNVVNPILELPPYGVAVLLNQE
jgi:beta-galactosidase